MIKICITLITIVIMEAITWLTHKYVMHGFLWFLHKDHHQPKYSSWFEKNDLFFGRMLESYSDSHLYNYLEPHSVVEQPLVPTVVAVEDCFYDPLLRTFIITG